jgi:hydroxymethylbilane synthase
VIASRRSPLARAQAEAVGRTLARLHRGLAVEFRWIESEGDLQPEARLADAGGKGMFVRRVEQALLNGHADLAVHSLKDIPSDQTAGLTIAAVPQRADVRDCLIAPEAATIDDLPHGALVGTSSPRRAAQLLQRRPDLQVINFRGNVDTRLRKVLEDRLVQATFLAMAGLVRVGSAEHATKPIDTDTMLPAACQGALALQCRGDDHVTLSRCLPLNDPAAAAAVHFERAVVADLHGDCHSPIAALAEPLTADARRFRVRVRVLNPAGTRMLHRDSEADTRDLARAARRIVQELRAEGADALLHAPPRETHQTVR